MDTAQQSTELIDVLESIWNDLDSDDFQKRNNAVKRANLLSPLFQSDDIGNFFSHISKLNPLKKLSDQIEFETLSHYYLRILDSESESLFLPVNFPQS